jgi:hypothetical protein
MIRYTPTAGGILAAAGALQDPTRQTFTRAEVAYLMRLAYDSGRTATYLDDIAELHATWARHPQHRVSGEQRYEQRLAEMGGRTCTYHGGEVDFETGRPVRHLEVAA